jgi:hypothetical protein
LIFYLQFGQLADTPFEWRPRMFLDDHQHDGCELIRAIEAKDWRAARKEVTDVELL